METLLQFSATALRPSLLAKCLSSRPYFDKMIRVSVDGDPACRDYYRTSTERFTASCQGPGDESNAPPNPTPPQKHHHHHHHHHKNTTTTILPQFSTVVRFSPVKNVHFPTVFHGSPVQSDQKHQFYLIFHRSPV